MTKDQPAPSVSWTLVGHLLIILIWSLIISTVVIAQPSSTLYSNDFQSAAIGSVPEDFKVITGEFTVKEESGNRFLEVGTDHLNSFGVLIGPERGAGTAITVRIRSLTTGKRYPEFGVGLGGVGGLRLILMPSINEIHVRQGDRTIARAPFKWKGGEWVNLHAELTRTGEGRWVFAGKAWMEGASQPAEVLVRHETTEALPNGRAVLWAMPYSEKPIQFDDVRVMER